MWSPRGNDATAASLDWFPHAVNNPSRFRDAAAACGTVTTGVVQFSQILRTPTFECGLNFTHTHLNFSF